ncbi:unnamed protein product [Victoria cruziana]
MVVKESEWWSKETVAVVTGAGRGLGLEISRQLADKGMTVIMTARTPQEKLSGSAKQLLQDAEDAGRKNVLFHTLDIGQEESVQDFVEWLKQQVGYVDILVNNAGIQTAEVDWKFLKQENIDVRVFLEKPDCGGGTFESFESAKKCLDINYFGTKKLTDSLLPFLRPSFHKSRIVMVSSITALLRYVRDEDLRKQLSLTEDLTEEKIEEVLNMFLDDLMHGKSMDRWPLKLPAYSISKAAINAYTRILARQLQGRAHVNSARPGLVRTHMTEYIGNLSVSEGAQNILRVALLPAGGPSGQNFLEGKLSEF